MEIESGISFCSGDSDEELFKKDATVEDLILTLKQFPGEMRVNAHFECKVDPTGTVVLLEDGRIGMLLDIILDCPFCSGHVEIYQLPDRTVN